jgi:hypothetical protein
MHKEKKREKQRRAEEALIREGERIEEQERIAEEEYREEDKEEVGLLPAVTYKRATKTQSEIGNLEPPKDSRFASVVAVSDRSLTEK